MAIISLSCKTFLEMLEPQMKLLFPLQGDTSKEDEMWWQILLAISEKRQTEAFKKFLASALVKKNLL